MEIGVQTMQYGNVFGGRTSTASDDMLALPLRVLSNRPSESSACNRATPSNMQIDLLHELLLASAGLVMLCANVMRLPNPPCQSNARTFCCASMDWAQREGF